MDQFDEYLHVANATGRECLKKFCREVLEVFHNTYLQRPTTVDAQSPIFFALRAHEFSGMLGNINCMHWA